MKHWWGLAWAIAFGMILGLLVAGVILLVSQPPRGVAVQLEPIPAPIPFVIQVSGAVAQPGLCELTPGSRVAQAIDCAGGLLPEADLHDLNLAARLEDGEHLRVPFIGERDNPGPTPLSSQPARPDARSEASTPSENALININAASQAELESLPGIGPVLAGKIIAYRQEHGPFKDIQGIVEVAGIGPATFEQIKNLITVGE